MSDRATELLKSARDDPDVVTEEALREAVRDVAPKEVSSVLRTVGIAIKADSSRADDFLSVLLEEAHADDRETRLAATRGISTIAFAEPSIVAEELPAVTDRFEDAWGPVRAAALRTLVSVANERADAVLPYLDRLPDRIADDHPYVGKAAVELLSQLVPEHTDEVVPLVDHLMAVLVDPPEFDLDTRMEWHNQHPFYNTWDEQDLGSAADRGLYLGHVASVLAAVAIDHPGELADRVPDLVAVLEREELPGVRSPILATIQAIAETNPEAAASAMDPVASVLKEDPTASVYEKAAWILAWLAEGGVEGIEDALAGLEPRIEAGLEEENDEVRGATIALLSYLAERDPAAVDDFLPAVRDMLDADNPQHRGMAVWTLAFAGSVEDRDRLERIADEDPHEYVRGAAEEGAAMIDERPSAT